MPKSGKDLEPLTGARMKTDTGLGEWVIRFRWWIIVATVLIVAGGGYGVKNLESSQTKNTNFKAFLYCFSE